MQKNLNVQSKNLKFTIARIREDFRVQLPNAGDFLRALSNEMESDCASLISDGFYYLYLWITQV